MTVEPPVNQRKQLHAPWAPIVLEGRKGRLHSAARIQDVINKDHVKIFYQKLHLCDTRFEGCFPQSKIIPVKGDVELPIPESLRPAQHPKALNQPVSKEHSPWLNTDDAGVFKLIVHLNQLITKPVNGQPEVIAGQNGPSVTHTG